MGRASREENKNILVNALLRSTSGDAFPPEAIMRFRGRTSIDITANVKRTAGLSLKIYSNIHRTAKKEEVEEGGGSGEGRGGTRCG